MEIALSRTVVFGVWFHLNFLRRRRPSSRIHSYLSSSSRFISSISFCGSFHHAYFSWHFVYCFYMDAYLRYGMYCWRWGGTFELIPAVSLSERGFIGLGSLNFSQIMIFTLFFQHIESSSLLGVYLISDLHAWYEFWLSERDINKNLFLSTFATTKFLEHQPMSANTSYPLSCLFLDTRISVWLVTFFFFLSYSKQ